MESFHVIHSFPCKNKKIKHRNFFSMSAMINSMLQWKIPYFVFLMLIVFGGKKGGGVHTWFALLMMTLKGQSKAGTGSCTLPYFSCFVRLPHIYGYDEGSRIAPEAEVWPQPGLSVCEDFWVPSWGTSVGPISCENNFVELRNKNAGNRSAKWSARTSCLMPALVTWTYFYFSFQRNNSPACTFMFRLSQTVARCVSRGEWPCAAAGRAEGRTRRALLPAARRFPRSAAVVPVQLCRAGPVGSCKECCGEERAAENADCLLMHLRNHRSGVRLQEDDNIAE